MCPQVTEKAKAKNKSTINNAAADSPMSLEDIDPSWTQINKNKQKSPSNITKVKYSHSSCSDCSKIFTTNSDQGTDISSFTDISKNQKELLHYHEKLDHMSFFRIKELARAGISSKRLCKADSPVCLALQMGKSPPSDGSQNKYNHKPNWNQTRWPCTLWPRHQLAARPSHDAFWQE